MLAKTLRSPGADVVPCTGTGAARAPGICEEDDGTVGLLNRLVGAPSAAPLGEPVPTPP
jgi:hypothetical protein